MTGKELFVRVSYLIKKIYKGLITSGGKSFSHLKMKWKQMELLIETLSWINTLQYSLINMFLLFCYCLGWSADL